MDVIPLSGQYRQSQLNFEAEARLLASGWPAIVATDLFEVHTFWFSKLLFLTSTVLV